ncbi:hypothetical protein ASZ78_003216 [Callipepla squamata]|uniref:Neurotransmitter-gated ion-channel transmembrane domain-containing protein n=1 Tax=Callipepla squamata TaxID=9009 RepID=A0A226NFC4_CALSU|nr:hypothetical protein ASZ78_003216 [Callipepla squamata]
MKFLLAIFFFVSFSLWVEEVYSKEKSSKKGKGKKKQYLCPSQQSAEDLARVPANSTSNILNRLLLSYDPRIRPNFKGIPVDVAVNIFINSFGSIQETTMIVYYSVMPFGLDLISYGYTALQDAIGKLSAEEAEIKEGKTEGRKQQVGYTTDDLRFIWQSGDPVQLEKIALPQFDIKKEDIEYGNCTKYYKGTGIFSVLSLASECTTLAAELPKVSYVKALDVWLIVCLLFGFASLVEYAVVQVMLNNPKRIEAEKAKIAKAEQAEGKGGNAAKKNTVNGTGTPVHISTLQVGETRCKKVCTSKSDLRSNDFSIVGSLPRDFELSNYDCYGKPIEVNNGLGKSQAKNNKKPPPPKPVIPSAAKRIDLYARALFPFCFLFFNVIYWSIYL